MSRSHTEKDKKQQEKFQAVLSRLLREEDNKYCVDCDAKGPRWASWNLGLFLCIRCAGIHRNLGVHISKVKSVNLDSWTEEQILSMESVGNTVARKYYECNLPANFRRPQTDSPLENFIRAKYEHKKYVDKSMQQPGLARARRDDSKENRDSDREKRKAKKLEKSGIAIPRPSENSANARKHPSPPAQTLAAQAAAITTVQSAPTATAPQPKPVAQPPAQSSNQADLFGLDTPVPVRNGDLLGLNTPEKPPSNHISPAHNANPAAANENVIEESLFGTEDTSKTAASKTSKESILALYGSSSQNQTIYGVPGGMYIPSQQNQMMNGGLPSQSAGGMPQQMGGMQQQQQYPQQNSYNPAMGMMGGQQQQQPGMMGGQGMMGMYNPNQAHIQQQQQQQQQAAFLQQVQAQMQNLRVGGGPSAMPQQQQQGGWGAPNNPPQVAAGVMQGGFAPTGMGPANSMGWGTAGSSGQTLSTQLWK